MLKLDETLLAYLKEKKNLLAFSGGVDSSALFHLLLAYEIPFDIAIVNYNLRKNAKEEYKYAHTLAKAHNLKCHGLCTTPITRNIEQSARKIRYDFFEELIDKHHYDTLVSAHQLNDKLEWFLMQLCKGSSLKEMLGMQSIERREKYEIIRPLLHVSRDDIYSYLKVHDIPYFEDESNSDKRFMRNRFRHKHAKALVSEYQEGIIRSFAYLQEESKELFEETTCKRINQLYYFSSYATLSANIKMADIVLKKLDIVLHHKDRARLKEQKVLIASRKFAVVIASKYIFIAPYVQATSMDKAFKERCRVLKIHPYLRGYLFEDAKAFASLCELLESA